MYGIIYFGNVDVIDTRTNKITTLERVMFRQGYALSDISGPGKKAIPAKEREYFRIHYLHADTAKIIGTVNTRP